MVVLQSGLSILGVMLVLMIGGLHKIEEGHVGVYYKFGVLQKQLSQPGYNFMIPFITKYENIQISVQTDKVTDIPCGTSGGVMIYFDKIEVVNQLKKELVYQTIKNYTADYDKIWIYDKIHYEINQFCSKHSLQEVFIEKFEFLDESLQSALQNDLSKWSPGIQIISIRVTKPKIPNSLKQYFEKMEQENTQLLIATERQRVQVQQAITKKQQAVIQAMSKLEVNKINIEKQIQEKQNELNISKIENQIYLQTEKSKVDAYAYNSIKELETNLLKLTPQYLKYSAIESLTNNIQFVIGEKIPQFQVGADTLKNTTKK